MTDKNPIDENQPVQSKNRLQMEFDELESKGLWTSFFLKLRILSSQHDFTMNEARKEENRQLNRYKDVVPYDHTRVRLQKEGFDYINANYLTVEKADRKYILTQGPLMTTMSHFWLMVWENQSTSIIMLNKVLEEQRMKCAQYWPASSLIKPHIFEDVGLRVEARTMRKIHWGRIQELSLTNTETGEIRYILHFHYTMWPDMGVPENPTVFLNFLKAVRQNGVMDGKKGPPIIHCSAGIGRTGTFCLVDTCLVLAEKFGVENVSVENVLLEMRKSRLGLIQTYDQLRFSYRSILEGLEFDWDSSYELECSSKENACDDENGMVAENGGSFGESSSSDDEPPPLPPPRNQSLNQPEKPLPEAPSESSSGSEYSSEEESEIETASTSDLDEQEEERLSNEEGGPRKRKFVEDFREKSDRISEAVESMKQKRTTEETKKRRKRLFLKSVGVGLAFFILGILTACVFRWRDVL